MTVESNTSRVSFDGDDATTSFPLGSGFVFFDASNLVVEVITDSTGASEELVLNTDYTVSGGDGATGTVDTSGGHGALLTGTTLVIRRVLPFTQTDDLVNGEIYDADVVETRLDKLTMLTQQLEERVGRALRASVVETAIADLPTPVERRAKLFFFADTAEAEPSIASAGDLGTILVLDEDDFASDSDESPPTQQSVGVRILALAHPKGQIVGFNAQTGTTYAPVASDAGKLITQTNGSAITTTINKNIFTAGDVLYFCQGGAGQITVAAGSGVTIKKGSTFTAKTLEQETLITLICVDDTTDANVFRLGGQLEAA